MSVVTAFVLGVLMILDPCTLFTGIVSVAYIDREIHNRKRIFSTGMMFVLGKLVTYTLLSYSILWGMRFVHIENFMSQGYGELTLALFFVICGILLLVTGKIHHNHDHGVNKWLQSVDEKSNKLWAFMLGIFFSIAFCPHRLFYFFTMIDLTMTQQSGFAYVLPVVFGLGTGIPILLVAWLLSFSLISANALQEKIEHYNKYIRYLCAIAFISYGLYTSVQHFGHTHHHHSEHVHCTIKE